MIKLISLILLPTTVINAGQPLSSDESLSYERVPISSTRRILKGNTVNNSRPYMVYLRATPNAEQKFQKSHWLCGGVIIDKRYILTSAACIEDAKHFKVISGTHKWVSPNDDSNECVNNGAKRAIWKCVPKPYFFDGDDFDNIRWMVGDIAVVKVEDDFNFEKKIRGCDFIPKKVKFNDVGPDLEKGGTVASIAGWGSTERFGDALETDPALRISENSVELQESTVVVISKKSCRNRWEERYHFIINDEMICTKDSYGSGNLNSVCMDTDIICKEMEIQDVDDDYYTENLPNTENQELMIIDPASMKVHTAAHQDATRRRFVDAGGFCENDHGGPLVVGHGKSTTVIGIMSACLTNNLNHKCYGPFLFTSVYKYRKLIACATDTSAEPSLCNNILRSPKYPVRETSINWDQHNSNEKNFKLFTRHNMLLGPSYAIKEELVKNSTINDQFEIERQVTETEGTGQSNHMLNMNYKAEWRSNMDLNLTSNQGGYVEIASSTVHPYPSIKALMLRKLSMNERR